MTQLSSLGRFDKLLLATDGSEFSEGAVRLALAMAPKCDAKLTVMTIVLSNPEYDTIAPQLAEAAEQKARVIIEDVRKRAESAGPSVETIIRHGQEPAREIVEQAEEMNADAIIMGRRGRRGLARMMVGDATARVCGQARCSVLVAPRHAQMWSKRVLIATDGSHYSDAAAEAAGKIAAICSLPVTVMSAALASHNAARRQEASDALERVKKIYTDMGLDADTILVEARRPEEAILETARAKGADIIVMGSHGRTGLQKVLLGSVSERVIGTTEGPVLVVKAG
jgi:nucleotide-binding universal stress UspA family protein